MPCWKLCYPLVWGTKNPLPLITAALEPELYRAIAAKRSRWVASSILSAGPKPCASGHPRSAQTRRCQIHRRCVSAGGERVGLRLA